MNRSITPRILATGLILAALGHSLAVAHPFNLYPPAEVGATPLLETSGIVESRVHPGTLWIHNDSGNPGVVYGIGYSGKIQASYNFGSQNDWEDIAVGPGKNGVSSIFVGDLGDNDFKREFARIYRIAEPETLTTDPGPIPQNQYQQAQIQYPKGPDDVEALAVDPISGDLYLFSKGATPADPMHVYRAGQSIFDPPPPGTFHVVEQLPTLSVLSRVTAADISPDGRWLIVRSRATTAYAWERLPGETIADALERTPIPVTLATEPQGEAIGWAADGQGFFTTSERENSKIYYYELPVAGDATLDRLVDGADYTIWADNYLKTGQSWSDGDFNSDGVVDGADYTIWADHYATGLGPLSAVPEPSSMALGAIAMASGVAFLASVRRRGPPIRPLI